MGYDRIIGLIANTDNSNRLLNLINKLSLHDKYLVLSNDKVKKRILSFNDISLLVNLLIDLPSDLRISFLSSLNPSLFKKDYEKAIIELLKLENYNDLDISSLVSFKDIKDKDLINTIFKKLSSSKLREIIIANCHKTVNNYAFLEYSKKEPDFVLEAALINNINNEMLFLEMKRRKARQKDTNLSIEEFVKLDGEKQRGILVNGDLKQLESEVISSYEERNRTLNIEELCTNFKKSLINFNYIRLAELQSIISVVDDITAYDLMSLFFKEVLHFDFQVEPRYIKSMIFLFRKQSEMTSQIYNLTKCNHFTIINYLNTGVIDNDISKEYEKYITCEQYQKTNNKKLNKIIRLCNTKFPNEYVTILAYKMYYILGYDNTIEFLNGKFGNIDNIETLRVLFTNCDVSKVPFSSTNEPALKESLIQFLMGDKKDNNITIKRILRGEIDILYREFSNLYNNLERYQAIIGNKIHLNKVLTLLRENPIPLQPNEYKFTKDILNDIINSFKYNDLNEHKEEEYHPSQERYVREACNFYHQYLENRYASTIPRVTGTTEDKYSYEVLRLNDPLILTLGYKTGCCFRLSGQSKEFLQYCSESLYARVIVIRNQYNEICSMIPIIRNGNIIAGNSIETNSKGNNTKVYRALEKAYDEIIRVSSENEENSIVVGLVTNFKKNCESTIPFGKYIEPISNYPFYTNFSNKLFVVAKQKDKSIKEARCFVPETLFFDERPKILAIDRFSENVTLQDEIDNRIDSIMYRLNEEKGYYLYFTRYTICSEDWYIKVSYDGIKGKVIKNDPRAGKEYNIVVSYLNEKLKNHHYDLDDAALAEITKPKNPELKLTLN